MKNALRRLFGAATAAALLSALAACGGDEGGKGGASGGGSGGSGKTLVFARGADAQTLDPAVINDGESVKVVSNLFDTLVGFKPGSLDLEPALAETWSKSADGLTWTFKLREAKFHDGTPVDAEAVAFSFERQRDTAHPAHTDACSMWDGVFSAVTSTRAVDARTVEMRLSRQFGPFEKTMPLFSMSIVSPTAWKSEGIDPATKRYRYKFGEKPVGSGPFRFLRWTRDDTIVLEANASYWGGAPKTDKLIFKTIKDNTQRLLAVEAGQVDIMDGMNPQDARRVRDNPLLRLETQPGLNIAYFAMNVTKPPFDDVRVRQAVAMVIDKKTILATAYDGMGDVAVNPTPRSLPYWKDQPDRKIDRERAKRLLAEAGHAAGLKFKLNCMDNPRDYMPRPEAVAIQIQQDLAAIGVTVEIEKLAWTRHRQEAENGRCQSCVLGWMADYGDIDDFLYMLLDKDNATLGSAINVSFYADETVHGWLTAARSTIDETERARLYGLAQEKIMADAPMVPLVTMPSFRVLSAKVKGYRIYPAGGEYFAGVSVE